MTCGLRVTIAAWATAALTAVGPLPALSGTLLLDFPDGRSPIPVETRRVDEITYLRLSDLAHGVGGARHWNPSTGKMTLAVGPRRIAMSADNPFVTLDRTVRNLGRPALLAEGSFWVPESFLRYALGEAMNAEVSKDTENGAYRFVKLGPVVTSLRVEERADGTAVILGLNELAEFMAESAERGAIELVVEGGRLVDSLAILDGAGFVSSVVTAEGPGGVTADIIVGGGAASFEASLYHDPYRIEVLVSSGRDDSYLTPALKERQGLLPAGHDVLGSDGGDVETVMIDPGHGGHDRGAIGPSGTVERDAMLALARELSRALQREGFYVFMTRSSDSYVPLQRRAELSNLAAADVLVSLQADAWYSRSARGFRVAYHAPAPTPRRRRGRSRGAGLRYVQRTGASRNESGLEWDHVQDAFREKSHRLARAVHDRMAEDLDLADRGLASRTLSVLSGCAMPAIMIEMGFISNGGDEERLADERFREEAARAIARGIADYRRDLRGRD
jgi:N-acetylmuramoyl-L-alanine amidase